MSNKILSFFFKTPFEPTYISMSSSAYALLTATLTASSADMPEEPNPLLNDSSPEDIYIGGPGIQNIANASLTISHQFIHYYGITGVCTDSQIPFTIEHSINGTDWLTLEGVFSGSDSSVTHYFSTPFVCEYLRVHWQNNLPTPVHVQFKGCAPTDNHSLSNTLEHVFYTKHLYETEGQ